MIIHNVNLCEEINFVNIHKTDKTQLPDYLCNNLWERYYKTVSRDL